MVVVARATPADKGVRLVFPAATRWTTFLAKNITRSEHVATEATAVVNAAQKWEYKILFEADIFRRMREVAEKLNQCGEEGWELVAAWVEAGAYILKRPKALGSSPRELTDEEF